MIPLRLELENFLSFGTPAVELDFDGQPLWVLSGPNGVGKSAVFDAITYALFGQHRGGAVHADQLVRHGANGFRVALEFAAGSNQYRVTRTRSGRAPTARVERRRAGGGWEEVDLSGFRGGGRADTVARWAEAILGLGFDAFTASVLLRQGEADRMITAGNKERLDLLKKVIGAERYETLSDRVHQAARDRKERLDRLTADRDRTEPVTSDQLAAGEAAVAEATAAWDQARQAHLKAVIRVEQAKRWDALQARHADLARQLEEARERLRDADRIRTDKARLDELASIVPPLEQLVSCRDAVAAVLPDVVDDLATAGDRAQAYLQDLSAQCEKTELAIAVARAHESSRAADAHGAESELRQTLAQLKRFSEVGVGWPCSLCGQVVDAAHAERELARLEWERQVRERALAAALQTLADARELREAMEQELRRLTRQYADHSRRLAPADQLAGLLQALPPTWVDRAASVTADEVRQLADERQRLDRAGVAQQFDQLQQDEQRVQQTVEDLSRVEAEMDAVPADARLSETEARQMEAEAARQEEEATQRWTEATRARDDLARRAAAYQTLLHDIAAAEQQHRLHVKLDQALGKGGLQRELVREAEREIVRLANVTAQALSYGDLTLELAPKEDRPAEAFDLQVRLGTDPSPIPVEYLSGSQKFRVAIAVALAIGQYAAGQPRPLGAVIIDEGFGCLDQDGLHATADELNRLKDCLQRILLVSHQEEFASRFPGGYRLTRTPDGTTAERYSR